MGKKRYEFSYFKDIANFEHFVKRKPLIYEE